MLAGSSSGAERVASERWGGLPGCSAGRNLPACAGDVGLILDWEDPREEEMAIHSSILAWEISQTEEPGGLQSMGPQRVRCDLVARQQVNSREPSVSRRQLFRPGYCCHCET